MPAPTSYSLPRDEASLTGAPSFGYQGAYGGVPRVPNPIATAGGAGAGNLFNLQGFQGLAGPLNQFNTQQQLGQLEQMIPGYTSATAKSTDNILQELSGQVPSDVVNQIIQSAAERGVMTGGGQNANAAYLRALGLTSLGMQQQGQQNLSAAVARTPRPGLFNPASMFVTPEQLQEAQYGANVLGGAPIPSQAAEEARRNALMGIGAGRGAVGGAPGFSYPNMSNFGGYGGSSFGGSPSLGTYSTPGSSFNWSNPGQFSPASGGPGTAGGDWLNQLVSGPMGNAYSQLFQSEQGQPGGGFNRDFSMGISPPQTPWTPGTPPPGTITDESGSRYDPYAQLTGGAYMGGGGGGGVSQSAPPYPGYSGGPFGGLNPFGGANPWGAEQPQLPYSTQGGDWLNELIRGPMGTAWDLATQPGFQDITEGP